MCGWHRAAATTFHRVGCLDPIDGCSVAVSGVVSSQCVCGPASKVAQPRPRGAPRAPARYTLCVGTRREAAHGQGKRPRAKRQKRCKRVKNPDAAKLQPPPPVPHRTLLSATIARAASRVDATPAGRETHIGRPSARPSGYPRGGPPVSMASSATQGAHMIHTQRCTASFGAETS